MAKQAKKPSSTNSLDQVADIILQPKTTGDRIQEVALGSLLIGGGIAAAYYLTDEEKLNSTDSSERAVASAKAGAGVVIAAVGILKGTAPLVEGLFMENKWVNKKTGEKV